ncbi:chemotaxis protein CheA [Anaeromyxobacter diazotrophicus]|nr:chemotaxis protein CheA [Anaeromyxobacter diazotrophicus]
MADRPSQRALSDFLSEAQEIVEALDKDLLRLEDTRHGQEADPDTLNAVFRAAHSLKGLAAMFGVERMTALAHALEDRLDDLRMGRRPLDAGCLDLLLAAPALFGRIVGEEAAQTPPGAAATLEPAAQLAARLRDAASTEAPAARDPLDALALDPSVRSVLTEYEEHRLRANVEKGAGLYRVKASFDLASFDTGLEDLKKRLKPAGEVISTLPSAEPSEPDAIAFDVLFGSAQPEAAVRAAAAPARAEAIGRRGAGGRSGPTATSTSTTTATSTSTGTANKTATSTANTGAASTSRPAATPASTTIPAATPAPSSALAPRQPAERHAAPAAALAAPAPPGVLEVDASLRSVSQAVRVDIHKLDTLMNLVGELVLVKTSLLGVAERLRAGEDPATVSLELHREGRRLERKLNELQGGILEVRMVPLGQIFDKLTRMVRKLTRDIGKRAELEVRGSEVELDKLIVEELSDPLMHLIRNALDHALEAPEERSRAGKPEVGRIVLSAQQRGNHVVVSVADDGRGIDEERVRQVAVERGLLTAEAAAQLSRRDALNLIFTPGFSTAREVTALSGRGVGMDVVKNNIAALSGIVDLQTEVGRGTRVDITLPVTLAIIRALVVSAAGRTYAVPLNSVLEIVTVDPRELRTVELREVLTLRGATVPLARLSRFLGHDAPAPEGPLFVVVVGLAQERLGLAVDALVGQQDIVVKPLGKALAGVRGIAGATDLGNRKTVLVLDVAALLEEVLHGEALAEAAG